MELLDKLSVISGEVEKNRIRSNFSHTWKSGSRYGHALIAYVFQHILKEFNLASYGELKRGEFSYDYGKSDEVVLEGLFCFCYKGMPCFYEITDKYGDLFHSVRSSVDLSELVDRMSWELKHDNPLKGKFCEITHTSDGLNVEIPLQPKWSWDDLILEDAIKEQIFDETIFQLQELKRSNAVLLHGEPGNGKTFTCSVSASEAIKRGFPVVSVESRVIFEQLKYFLDAFCHDCLLILDEIGQFSEDRKIGQPGSVVDDSFLRFLNGVSSSDNCRVVMATTNDFELIEKALKRAGRFSSNFAFPNPNREQRERMICVRFREEEVSEFQIEQAAAHELTGAEIAEIERRSSTISLKRGISKAEAFDEAVSIVSGTFVKEIKTLGFGT